MGLCLTNKPDPHRRASAPGLFTNSRSETPDVTFADNYPSQVHNGSSIGSQPGQLQKTGPSQEPYAVSVSSQPKAAPKPFVI